MCSKKNTFNDLPPQSGAALPSATTTEMAGDFGLQSGWAGIMLA